MNNECLHCKWLKLETLEAGICRREKGENALRPVVKITDTCTDWLDAGPQYHIRMGWIKNQKKKV